MSALSKVSFRVRLLLVRHAESELNVLPHILGGQHNHVPLTCKGVHQATLLGHRLKFDKIDFDHVYTSTAVRAKMTAKIALETAGLKEKTNVSHSETLLEQTQGEWEGKDRADVYTPEVHQEMLDQHLDFSAPNGESLRDVLTRATNFLNVEIDKWRIVSEKEKREVTLGVFAHGGSIRTILNSYLGIRDEWTWLVCQDNTAMNEIVFDTRGTATMRINDAAHLRYAMIQAPTLDESQPSPLASATTSTGEPTTTATEANVTRDAK